MTLDLGERTELSHNGETFRKSPQCPQCPQCSLADDNYYLLLRYYYYWSCKASKRKESDPLRTKSTKKNKKRSMDQTIQMGNDSIHAL